MKFGKYTVTEFDKDSYFISHESGEGMQVNKAVFDGVIEKFYQENF